MKKHAAIFDLDGTLVNSLEDIAGSMNRVLAHYGYPSHSYDEYKLLVGEGLKNLTERCLPEGARSEDNIARCLAMMMKVYSSCYVEKSHLYNGIPDLLDELSSRKLKVSILSNKADELTQQICGKLLNKWNFELIVGHSDRFPRKPNPASALYIAQSMNVEPQNIIYMGDTAIDMKTANAAGMFAVGVTWGFRGREELASNGAKVIIDSPMELVSAL